MFNEFISQIMDCHMENESCTGMDLIFIIIGGKAIHMDMHTVLDVAVTSYNWLKWTISWKQCIL